MSRKNGLFWISVGLLLMLPALHPVLIPFVGVPSHLLYDDPPGHQILLVDRTAEVTQEREMERQAHLATLGEALAGVAHELNNPLSVITAWSGLGADPESHLDEMREGFEIVGRQAQRMQGLVQELLGYSRSPQDEGLVRADEFVERVVRMQRMAPGSGTRLEMDVQWRGEVSFSGSKLEQILVNLVSNAADAVPDGSGRVMLTLREEGGEVIIEVVDNGPGVAPEVVGRIFEPFFTTKPEGRGTGLGLAISRRLAVSMGGDLEAGSSPSGGALFTLRVPGAAPAGPAGPEGSEVPEARRGGPLAAPAGETTPLQAGQTPTKGPE